MEGPMIFAKVTEEQASGTIPMLEKGVWNVAFEDAIMTSQ